MHRSIEISSGTIIRAILLILLVWFLFVVRDIIMLVILSLIIVSAIDPIVDWFQRKKIPRTATVLLIYVVFLALIGFTISLLVSPIASEIKGLGNTLPVLIEKMNGYFQSLKIVAADQNFGNQLAGSLSGVSDNISNFGSNLFSGTISFFGGVLSFLIVLSIAFYLCVQESGSKKFFASLLPAEHQKYALELVDRIQHKMGRWLQGQIVLMVLVFIIDYIGLLIIGAPYALILAIMAGILEIVPYVGPIISAVVATIFGLLHGPVTGLLVLILFASVQQLEGYVFAPLIMKKAVGLNPVVVIIALIIGAKLSGVLGVIVSVPIATAVGEIIKDLTSNKEDKFVEKIA
jgi:predicted PurR-regulated permease PerM